MSRLPRAARVLLLIIGLTLAACFGVSACTDPSPDDPPPPPPSTFYIQYGTQVYCGYRFSPYELDMYGQALVCTRVIFPSPAVPVARGTLAAALLTYLETYDSFYDSGWWYDRYYAPLGPRYHITLVTQHVFTQNVTVFRARYGPDITRNARTARWQGTNRVGPLSFPTRGRAAAGQAPTSRYTAPGTTSRDSRVPTRTTTRRASTYTPTRSGRRGN